MMTLKSLNLFFVSLLLGAASVLGQQTATPPAAPTVPVAPTAPAAPIAPDAPAAFSFSFEGSGFLGIYIEEINKENMSRYGLQREPRGVGVRKVVAGGPAERAGLRETDVILKFDNEAVTSVRKLNRLIREVAPEHTARLTISRGGQEKEVTVTLGKRGDFNAAFGAPGQRWEALDKSWDFKFDDKNNKDFTFVYGNNRRIGVTTTQLTKQLADYFGVAGGLLITSVRAESPAAKAGLRAGDIITEIDGSRVETVEDLMRALNRKDEGDLTLTIMHDKSQRTIRLTPERSKDSNFQTPGAALAPQAMQIAIPAINMEMPKIVIPALPQMQLQRMPKIIVPNIRVNVPARVLTLPAIPL